MKKNITIAMLLFFVGVTFGNWNGTIEGLKVSNYSSHNTEVTLRRADNSVLVLYIYDGEFNSDVKFNRAISFLLTALSTGLPVELSGTGNAIQHVKLKSK